MFTKSKKLFGLMAVLLVLSLLLAACGAKATATDIEVPEPSNPGGPGEAVNLTGDAKAGADVYQANCVKCHGEEGKGGIENAGSEDGTIPELNPLDPGLLSKDAKTNIGNIDKFIEHGAAPEGDNPAKLMPAFGDQKVLTPQQIADVIAYVISLNPAK